MRHNFYQNIFYIWGVLIMTKTESYGLIYWSSFPILLSQAVAMISILKIREICAADIVNIWFVTFIQLVFQFGFSQTFSVS